MNHIVYLDNSATTKPCDKAVAYIKKSLEETWGNPSSLHRLGMEAEISVSEARKCIADSIKARPDEIIFTGSGTEANNMAIMAALGRKKRGNRVITTTIEHPAILNTVKRLEDEGFEVIRLKPDSKGIISLDDLKQSLNSDTVLVSIMLVNNEVGSIQPVTEAASLTHKLSPNAIFHCDAVQGYGKLPINVSHMGIDLMSASGHKIHASKGIGFLYCKKGIHIPPFITGGGQENGMRSGTEPVPLIRGLMGAVEELPNLNTQLEKQRELYNYAKSLFEKTDLIKINSFDEGLPYIMNISVTGYRSETILHYLESKNIFVSSGSACSKGHVSYVLAEMGLDKKYIDSTLRLSFSRYNTKEDIDLLYTELNNAVNSLRKA